MLRGNQPENDDVWRSDYKAENVNYLSSSAPYLIYLLTRPDWPDT